MCGRFDQNQPTEKYLDALNLPSVLMRSQAPTRFNVAPGMYRPVLHADGESGAHLVDDLHWGYQASWAVGKVPVTINTRLEKITGKYWSRLLKTGRAIVAVDGWYEWTGEKGNKQPWHIHRATKAPVFMAALGSFGTLSDNNRATAGFTIITADALGGMVDVHDRRPVVLSAQDAILWMDPALPPAAAEQLARTQALGPQAFAWHQVTRAVGSVRNDGTEMAEPVDTDEHGSGN